MDRPLGGMGSADYGNAGNYFVLIKNMVHCWNDKN